MATADHFLDRYLDPVADILPPAVAEEILNLQPDAETIAYVKELGEKSNAGTITDDERDEYHAPADAGTLVALFKTKARRSLASSAR